MEWAATSTARARPRSASPRRRGARVGAAVLGAWRAGQHTRDLVIALPALVLALPIMLLAGLLVRLTSPGPALFRQIRIGQYERPFTMLKLRTMHVDGDDSAQRELNLRELRGEAEPGTSDGVFKLEADPRLTPVGGLLRRFSLDELPQLLNVLRGDMALVGPRPSLPWEVGLYTDEQRRRHQCRPGITGLWQVSGRNRLSMKEMLALDVVYTERRSFLLDLWILLRTPYVVLFARDGR
jgi:lipopolysaccharide/colanic/teichoic acid biosynthesis glycosyltransferase